MAQKIGKKAREWTDEQGINTEIKINSVWMHWDFKFLKEKLKREETAATFPSVLLQNLVYQNFKAAILDFMMPQKSCFFSKLVVDIRSALSIVLDIYQNHKTKPEQGQKHELILTKITEFHTISNRFLFSLLIWWTLLTPVKFALQQDGNTAGAAVFRTWKLKCFQTFSHDSSGL